MNDQTKSILNSAIHKIELYRKNKVNLSYLVNFLEGSIRAIEEKLPKEFCDSWDSSCSELEICLALNKQDIYRDNMLDETEKIRTLFEKYLSAQEKNVHYRLVISDLLL